jgi:hypothetical protein
MRTRPTLLSIYLICCNLFLILTTSRGQAGFDIVERSMYLSDDIAMIHTVIRAYLLLTMNFPFLWVLRSPPILGCQK